MCSVYAAQTNNVLSHTTQLVTNLCKAKQGQFYLKEKFLPFFPLPGDH